MRTTGLIAIVIAGMALAACEGAGQKQTAGTILGGIGGAVAGAQFGSGSGQLATTAIGTLLGAYLGSEIGSSLDRADQAMVAQAEQAAHSAPVGERIVWNNPDSGHALLLSISLLEEARGRGLNLAMAAKSFLGIMDAGYRSTSYTIVLDENRPSRRTAEKLGCRPERNFVIYSRDLGS